MFRSMNLLFFNICRRVSVPVSPNCERNTMGSLVAPAASGRFEGMART